MQNGYLFTALTKGAGRVPKCHTAFQVCDRTARKLSRNGPCLFRGVIWFFEKKGEHLRCEIRQQVEGDRFALVVTLPDGTERTELFDDSGAINRRSVELEKMLTQKGWNGPYARDI